MAQTVHKAAFDDRSVFNPVLTAPGRVPPSCCEGERRALERLLTTEAGGKSCGAKKLVLIGLLSDRFDLALELSAMTMTTLMIMKMTMTLTMSSQPTWP